MRCRLLWTIAWAILPAFGSAAEWGNLSGRFIYDGDPPETRRVDASKEPKCPEVLDESLLVSEERGLANVVIFVSSKNVSVHPGYDETAKETAVIKRKDCRIDPHVLSMRLTQTLEIVNEDRIAHNSNLSPLGDTEIGRLLPDGPVAHRTFNKAQNSPVPVSCNIHPWEKGYVVVKEHPYVAITDRAGEFKIKQLPVGELEFRVWHERAGLLRARKDWGKQAQFKLKIKTGENALGPIKVAPQLFERR